MRKGKKRARSEPGSTKHPQNKYSDNPPDFTSLASLYPSFKPYVIFSGARPRIDWTDYNATRELTRILLLHDHGVVNWWIPDGQLCPTVPNRSNYIHWINDLLSSEIVQSLGGEESKVKGFDIGTGANCIYPLLGASLFGWSFVGSDFTDVALEWAVKNVQSNPHISDLIEIRDSKVLQECSAAPEVEIRDSVTIPEEAEVSSCTVQSGYLVDEKKSYTEPSVLLGVVKEDETFDFCMCNPPFFETIEESGLNPKTACGGTHEEMVCNGGEQAFVSRIIEDSVVLKQRFRWYTSMLGKKSSLKLLMSKLWEVGVTVVKTTEFVQGQTSRWGLAWSFMPTARKVIAPRIVEKSVLSLMLEGIKRQYNAIDVLQSVEDFFKSSGALCKLNSSTFSVDIVVSGDQCNTISKNGITDVNSERSKQSLDGSSLQIPEDKLSFRILVFQQIPGTLLIKGSLQKKDSPLARVFSVVFGSLEESLKSKFCR